MKKILSAALALVCIWFATPAQGANCNLTQRIINKTYTGVGSSVVDEHALISGITYKENTPYTITIDVEPSNITFSEDGNLLWWSIKYTDGSSNYTGVTTSNYNNGRVSVTTSSNKTVESISGLSNHERWTGGTLKVSNLQIEEGSTATPYKPYNPLCATCDGTIVNYVSATGTVSQSGTPTPDNPIYPTFYTQGNMVLRKVGNYADSYDASTGKITRRITQTIFDGTEDWYMIDEGDNLLSFSTDFVLKPLGTASSGTAVSNYFKYKYANEYGSLYFSQYRYLFVVSNNFVSSVEGWKQFLAQQYAAGTPVTVWYPLRTETTEDWAATQCLQNIRVATTKYNESAFGPLNTALQNAISVVDSVVSNTITQAASIATLQAQKQTRPADDPSDANNAENCPAGKKCLLVEDASGVPHWYEIVENAWDLPAGYTQLEYIESTGTQYIDTGVTGPARWVGAAQSTSVSDKSQCILGADYVNNSAYSASVYLASQIGSSGVVWRLGSALSTVATTDYAEYDVNFAETSFSGTINGESLSVSGVFGFTNWYIGMDRGTSSIYYFIGKIYTQKAYQNDTLVRDMIPAKDAGGVIGMYDTVNNRFYRNAGTGEFIAGDPVAE